VRADSVLHFVIDIPSGSQQSRLTTSISPKPRGEINFDAKSREFTFAPNQADHQEFAVSFNLVATNGNVLATSRVAIIPIPTATSQFKTLFSEGPTPPIGGTEYLTIEEKPRTVKELFNSEQRALVDVTVIGNEVTFDRSADENGLVARFEGRKDIKTLLITADTLIIRTAWHLPQASVQIYARRLIFEDKAPTREGVSPACIDITPASDWNPAAPADENRVAEIGADGHSGAKYCYRSASFPLLQR
jgi:hypothetical protein